MKKSSGHEPSNELLAWAEREGVDLINVKIKPSGGDKWFYAFRPLGMKVWRIENSRFDQIEKELRESNQLALPAPWEGPLAQFNEKTGKYNDELTVTFLFMTREGSCGAMQIRSPLGDGGYTNGGLEYKFIYEKGGEEADSRRCRQPATLSGDSRPRCRPQPKQARNRAIRAPIQTASGLLQTVGSWSPLPPGEG